VASFLDSVFTESNQFLGERYSQHMVAYPAKNTNEQLPFQSISTKDNILYIHIPFCTGKCTYCSYVTKATKSITEIDKYLDYLEIEARILNRSAGKTTLKSIYIGGGTPTMLSIAQLDRLYSIIYDNFDLNIIEEFSLEGCPETLTKEKALFSISCGVNRASIGVESFDNDILRKMNRRHTSEDSTRVIDQILETGLDLDIDLITCYPGYTVDKIYKDIELILKHKPTSVSTYRYTVKPSSVDFKHYYPLLSRQQVLEQSHIWYNELQNIGYFQRNVDWFFVDSNKRFIHQEHKLNGTSNHIVLGVSGYGIIGNTQYYNTKKVSEYYEMLDKDILPVNQKQKLSKQDMVKRKLMFKVRGSIPTTFVFPEPEKIDYLLNKKLLEQHDNEYKLSTSGQLFINEIQEYLCDVA
jgi:coproporphyrinogen III oxidase-like Fe-S oxidoreductase